MSDTIEDTFDALESLREEGIENLGLMSSGTWKIDPKRLVFVLSRYKFVAKMLEGKQSVLEIGCGDGFASRIVREAVDRLVAVDIESRFIALANESRSKRYPICFREHDFVSAPMAETFDAIYALDVIEHICPDQEKRFLDNILSSLNSQGCLILGAPSLESQQYASEFSKMGHVNCKTGSAMKKTLKAYFHQVFLFSMNDEVVHTGFSPMAHYIFLVCAHPKG